jgi:3-deoxy-D-manno-octulosonate 8-phosphate phosphatase (KDO 8-P phosphatase)
MGVALVREAGLKTAILTGESTEIVKRRGAKLRIDRVFVGVSDKLTCMRNLLEELGLTLEQVAYIGDDVNDYELLCHVGLAVAVRDASRLPKSVAHLITEAKGGEGAVRELCEIILEAQREHPPLPKA